ncbi:hypothetical protein [Spirosoma aerolatum]|uniref:hypothetical protein n=1 Tax=Spirosoma aerolatum TaxID=1211326 RepID=UPI0012D2EDA9|nr:hypothetical protein [Spirosoma aerolatum]
MARKAIVIDWEEVNRCLRCMVDGPEIAAKLGISDDTLYRACKREHKMLWQNYAAKVYASTRQLLREQQINRAVGYKRKVSKPFNTAKGIVFKDVIEYVEPSDQMLKWLGIQYLNQRDKADVTLDIPDFIIVNDSDEDEPDDEEELNDE